MSNEWLVDGDDMDVRHAEWRISAAGLAERLRSMACPAGEPWTGTNPDDDHGHTDCAVLTAAALQLERQERVIDQLMARLVARQERKDGGKA